MDLNHRIRHAHKQVAFCVHSIW